MNMTETSIYQPNIILTNNQLTIIVIVFIIACLFCIYVAFIFGRRLQNSAIIRSSLVDDIKQQEYDKLVEQLRNTASEGALDLDKNKPPANYDGFKALWYPDKYQRIVGEGKKTQEEIEELNWEQMEKKIFEDMCKGLDEKALKIADKKVPKSMDISLLGGGFSFLLEFSTVIVIIFTLLILGTLGNLEGREISTILASIAGYVLGKASSSGKESTSESSSSMQGSTKIK